MAKSSPPPTLDPIARGGIDTKRGLEITQPWLEWFADLATVADTRPSCYVFNSVVFPVPNNAATFMTFDSEDHDTASMHDGTTNTGRLTIPEPGVYQFGFHCIWEASATGIRHFVMSVNGDATAFQFISAGPGNGDNSGLLNGSRTRSLIAGDYLEVKVFQDSGAQIDVQKATLEGNERTNGFWAFKVSS